MKPKKIIAIASLVSILLAGSGTAYYKYWRDTRDVKIAEDLMEVKLHNEAEEMLDIAKKKNPKNARAWFYDAYLDHLRGEDYTIIHNKISRALSLDEDFMPSTDIADVYHFLAFEGYLLKHAQLDEKDSEEGKRLLSLAERSLDKCFELEPGFTPSTIINWQEEAEEKAENIRQEENTGKGARYNNAVASYNKALGILAVMDGIILEHYNRANYEEKSIEIMENQIEKFPEIKEELNLFLYQTKLLYNERNLEALSCERIKADMEIALNLGKMFLASCDPTDQQETASIELAKLLKSYRDMACE